MLPNSASGLPAGRRQHRRQNSTPSAAQGQRFSPYNPQQRREAGHRRGMSLDLRQLPTTSSAARQEYSPNSTTNHNAGLAAIPQHHVLREAQQQSQQARPGPGNQQAPYTNLSHSFSDSSYLVSPHGTPQTPNLDPSCLDGNSTFDMFTDNANAMMQNNQINVNQAIMAGQNYDLLSQTSPLSTPNPSMLNFNNNRAHSAQNWASEGENAHPGRPARRISNGIADQVSKFEKMGMETGQRESTPPFQTYNDTPNERASKHDSRPDRFSDDYDGSMEETIRPSRNRSNPRNLSIFAEAAQQSGPQSAAPSPPCSSTFSSSETFGGAQMGTSAAMNAFEPSFNQHTHDDSFGFSSNHGTPSTPHHAQFSAPFENTPGTAQATPHHSQETPASAGLTPTAQSNDGSLPPTPSAGAQRSNCHRRTDSLASVQSAASISNINFDDAKLETGVTLNDIARFIEGPNLMDGMWTCTYQGCNKKFGRKENIKSHVQTHLNDRQYQCPTCMKCFVRQHDLKRHAKIHTGVKPYPCQCGNTFARHDALTRHRQRGMCVGAFDGVVKKNVKRGRPRKPRPDNEERQEKKQRTRKKNMSTSSVSSQSAFTDSSAAPTPFDSPSSPVEEADMLENMIDLSEAVGQYDNNTAAASSSSAPMPTITPQAISPHAAGETAPSPSSASLHSFVSPQVIMGQTPPNLSSPATSDNQLHTPPPEAPSTEPSQEPEAAFLTVDSDTSGLQERIPNLTASSSVATSSALEEMMPVDYGADEMRSYLAFAEENVGSVDKFEDFFTDNEGYFDPNSNDSFFGASGS